MVRKCPWVSAVVNCESKAVPLGRRAPVQHTIPHQVADMGVAHWANRDREGQYIVASCVVEASTVLVSPARGRGLRSRPRPIMLVMPFPGDDLPRPLARPHGNPLPRGNNRDRARGEIIPWTVNFDSENPRRQNPKHKIKRILASVTQYKIGQDFILCTAIKSLGTK